MKRITTLQFHRNDDGQYGLVQDPAIPLKPWGPTAIFSEVFERYFITQHVYFTEANAINLASEIAAMGHRYYLLYTLNPSFFHQMTEEEREAYILEMTQLPNYLTGNLGTKEISYCSRYWSKVAYQSTNVILDPFLKEHWRQIRSYIETYTSRHLIKKARSKPLSIYKGNIQRPYRWGYHKAYLMVHNNDQNRETLNQFYEAFQQICQLHPEELAQHYSRIEFSIHTGSAVQWDARFITNGNVSVNYKYFCNKTYKALKAA